MTPVEMTRDQMVAIEAQNRRDLEAVSLVAELDLDVDSPQFIEAYTVVTAIITRNGPDGIEIVGRNYPACTAITLATLGMRYGDGGEFWATLYESAGNSHRLPYLNAQRQAAYGTTFLAALNALELPTFSHVEGRKFLTPILLHGGLPASGVRRVWKALAQQVERGYEDGREIVARWRRDSDEVQGFTRPVHRFILETGRFASDLIRRMASVLIDESGSSRGLPPADVALKHRVPRIFVEELRAEGIRGLERRDMLPRPYVFFDQVKGEGPRLHLPTLPKDSLDSTWRVTDSLDEPKLHHTSAQRIQDPVLNPSDLWTCELVDEDEIALSPAREFGSFDAKPLWFFRETQRGIEFFEPERTLDAGRVIVLARKVCRIEIVSGGETLRYGPSEDFPELAGKWTNYAFFDVTVLEGDSFGARYQTQSDKGDLSFAIDLKVVAPPIAPAIEAEMSNVASDLQGRRLFVGLPKIVFPQVCLNPNLFNLIINRGLSEVCRTRLDAIPNDGKTFSLDGILDWSAGSYTVRVLGPLGSDLVEQFVFLPELMFEPEVRAMGPYGSIQCAIKIRDCEPVEIEFSEGQSRSELTFDVVDEEISLSVEIPRILFDVVRVKGGLPSLGAHPIMWTDEEYFASTNAELVLKLPSPGALKIHLRGAQDTATHTISTEGDGFLRIELARFNDDIRSLRSPLVELSVEAPSLGVAEFSVGQVKTQVRAEFQKVEVLETQAAGKHLAIAIGKLSDAYSIQVVATNRDMPWLGNRVFDVPTMSGTAALVTSIDEPLPPGRYELRAYVAGNLDGQALHVAQQSVGTQAEVRNYIDQLPVDGRGIAIRAIHGHRPPVRLSREHYLEGLPIAGEFLVSCFLDNKHSAQEKRACREFVFNDEFDIERFAWMGKVFASESKSDLERLIVALYPDIVDTPSESISSEQGVRLWRASPLLGAAVTYPSRNPEILAVRNRVLGSLANIQQDVAALSRASDSHLAGLANIDFDSAPLLSDSNLKRCLARFVLTTRKRNPRDAKEFSKRVRKEILPLASPITEQNASLVKSLESEALPASPWAAIPAEIQLLAALVVEPQKVGEKAARQLADATRFARPLVQRCILAALFQTRMRDRAST